LSPSGSFDTDNLPNGNAGAIVPYDPSVDMKGGTRRKSFSRRVDDLSAIDSFPEPTQAGDLISATVRGRRPPPVSHTSDLESGCIAG
jgi:centromeric protein E